jgi:hypothetical protein
MAVHSRAACVVLFEQQNIIKPTLFTDQRKPTRFAQYVQEHKSVVVSERNYLNY